MVSPRLPRFKRSPQINPLQLTDRDREILRHVHRHRFLRSKHLTKLVTGSRQQILRRLQRLYHHGYLDRPRTQIDYYRHGSQAMVYGLGRKGMVLLEREDGIPRRRLDWSIRNRIVTRFFIAHTLSVADVMVALECSCRQGGIELLRQEEKLKWHVLVRHEGESASIGVVPDQVFGLKTKTGTRWLFLEADRATMPVERLNLKQTSFARKLWAYRATWQQNVLKNSFPRFQVLTVTTSPERIEHLIVATREFSEGKGSGLFLFTHRGAFNSNADVMKVPLLNGRGETVTLAE